MLTTLYIRRSNSEIYYDLTGHLTEIILADDGEIWYDYGAKNSSSIYMVVSELEIRDLPKEIIDIIQYYVDRGVPVMIRATNIQYLLNAENKSPGSSNITDMVHHDVYTELYKFSRIYNNRISNITSDKNELISFSSVSNIIRKAILSNGGYDIDSLDTVNAILNTLMNMFLSRDMISHIMIDVIIPRYIVASGEISIYSNTKLIVIKLKSILLRRVIMRDNDLYTAMIHVINMIDGIPLDMDSGDDYKYESLLNKSISNVIENLPQDDIEVCDLIVSIMSYIVGSLISHDMNMRWIKTLDSKFQVIAMNSINDIRIEQGYMLIKCADIENSFVGKE